MTRSLLGRKLDKYSIVSLIGEGGMGSVYLAEHATIKKKVAVKVLHPYLAEAHPAIAKRMLNEARAAAMIGHPDIADVLDYGETDDGYHYLVMELLHGKELSSLIKEKGKLETDLTLAVGDHLLSALAAAHDKGIIHRDLKPDNIFLHVDRTGVYQVKLLDFGISKFTSDGDMRMTATGAVMGTPYYMSLEQAEGSTNIDHRTDIYSTGVILYQALSGSLPFTGDNPNQVMVAILAGKYKPLEAICPHLDQNLVAIISKAMSQNRDDRFSSASELKEALRPFWDPMHPSIQDAFESLGVDHGKKPTSSQGILGSGGFSPAPSLVDQSAPSPSLQRKPNPPRGNPVAEKKGGSFKHATAATMADPQASKRIIKNKTVRGLPASEPPLPPPPLGKHTPAPPPPEAAMLHPPAPGKHPRTRRKKRIIIWASSIAAVLFLILLIATKGFTACNGEAARKQAEKEAAEKQAEKEAEEKRKAKKQQQQRKRKTRRQPKIIRDIRRIF